MPRTGKPQSNTSCGALGAPGSVVDSGPPDRMMPLAPNAAGDQLGVLRAEIEDEDLVGVDALHRGNSREVQKRLRRHPRPCGNDATKVGRSGMGTPKFPGSMSSYEFSR